MKLFNKNSQIIQIEPWINYEEAFQLLRVIKNRYVTEYKLTQEFENKIRTLTNSKHAISITNGTLALYVILKTLGIGKGDEVIVPDLTFIATANAVLMTGAKPVLCDVNLSNWGIDPNKVESLITEKTKAVIPVHLYGSCVDIIKLKEISLEYKIHLIEDAAQGVGVFYKKYHVGTFGIAGMLSFYGNKTITCGEGGIILTNSDKLAKEIFKFKNHGRNQKGTFIHEDIGYNFSFTEMQAAIGIAQMNKLERIIKKKELLNKWYRKELNKDISFMPIPKKVKPVYWFNSIKCSDIEKLQAYLKKELIQTRRIFYPLHMQPCYKDFLNVRDDFKNSKFIFNNFLSLPSSFSLKKFQLKRIASRINSFYSKKSNL